MSKVDRATLDRMADELGAHIILADGFDEAICGVVEDHAGIRVVYDTDKIIGILMAEGMSHEEAGEYLEFNILGAVAGDVMPVFTVDTSRWADGADGADAREVEGALHAGKK